ncbi:MAG: glycosyltransferase family 2 protein [Rhodospirillaceae bacterium]|nr:glycosyltransferase family 2 protein [Rhodospirillaceae bacterium]
MRSSDSRSEPSPEDDADATVDTTASAITVVTVAHNSASVLPSMLASVPEGVPVIVVDNGSRDSDSIASIAEQHGARLIRNEENVGFGRACNQGAALAKTPLILFLNPDAELVGDALDRLAEASRLYPDAGAFNPAIGHPNGAQFFRRSSPISRSRPKPPRGWPSSDRKVPVLSGSALLVSKRNFDAVGGFDPEIFLYCEDDDLCLRLEASCGPLMFIRNARVIHHLGGLETLRLKGRSFGHSLVYASLKHKKPMAFERALIRAAGMAFSLSSITSKTHRIWAFSHLQGVLSARRFNPPTGTRLRKWILRSRAREGPTTG